MSRAEITGYQCRIYFKYQENTVSVVVFLFFLLLLSLEELKNSCGNCGGGIENSIFILCEENSIRKRFQHGK